jgi:hypothetical protein
VGESIDWGSLEHAYGPAWDTPQQLAALASADPEVQREAMEHLGGAVFHQETLYSATGPAVRVVAGMLVRGEVAAEVQDFCLDYVGHVAEEVARVELIDAANHLLPALVPAVRESYPAVVAHLLNASRRTRRIAGRSLVQIVQPAAMAELRPDAMARLRQLARVEPPDDRAYYVRLLGQSGGDCGEFLVDGDVQVRTAAALSPALAADDTADGLIAAALAEAAENNVADPEVYELSDLVAAAARGIDFERLVSAAVRLAADDVGVGWDPPWGPLLGLAFRPPYQAGRKLTPAQRRMLAVLVANDRIWRQPYYDESFDAAGLPYDREECRRIAGPP